MQSKYELALNHFLILSNRLKLEYSMQKPILKTFAFYDLAHHHYNDIKESVKNIETEIGLNKRDVKSVLEEFIKKI